MTTINLKCKCGAVKGSAHNITPRSGNRVACSCSDCQAFANFLDRGADTLDQCGGTEVFQTSQSQIKIDTGRDNIRCLRLAPKGLHRWYSACCNTPIGNAMGAGNPFFGLIHTFMDVENREENLGEIRAYCQTKDAIAPVDHPKAHSKFPLGITARIIRQMAVWKLQGKNKPSAFYDDNGRPISKPNIAGHETP